jgi:hypothetical protein
VSKRSKRRQGPHRGEGDGATETPRVAEPGARQDEARAADGGRSAPSSGEARRSRRGDAGGRSVARAASRQTASGSPLGVQLALLVAVFGVVVVAAELAGAANLGVALGVGQIAFAIAVIYLLVRR